MWLGLMMISIVFIKYLLVARHWGGPMHFSQFKMMKVKFIEDVIRSVCGGWKLSIDTVTPKPGYTSLATAPYSPRGLEGMSGIEMGI